MFHPTQKDWALAASWTSCADFVNEPCKIYKKNRKQRVKNEISA